MYSYNAGNTETVAPEPKTHKLLIKNAQHTLFQQQEELLPKDYTTVNIPAEGLTYEEQFDLVVDIVAKLDRPQDRVEVFFASPVPAMLKLLATASGKEERLEIFIFHNDRREKKELPGGKIIQMLAQEGWQLV
jgi:hypothetical protein